MKKQKQYILKNRKYSAKDFVYIPFAIAPLPALGNLAVSVFYGLAPAINAMLLAEFINMALAIFNGNAQNSQIILPLILMGGMMAFGTIAWFVSEMFMQKFKIKISLFFRMSMIDKMARLEYKHIEDDETYNLISRSMANPAEVIGDGYDNITGFIDIGIRIISIVSLLVFKSWQIAAIVAAGCIPQIIVAIRTAKKTHKANVAVEQLNRKCGYLHEVLHYRQYSEERQLFGYAEAVNKSWFQKFEEARKVKLKALINDHVKNSITGIAVFAVKVAVVGLLLFSLSKNQIDLGMFMGLVAAVWSLISSMVNMPRVCHRMAYSLERMKDITSFANLSEKDGATDLPDYGVEFETAEFVNVSFKYPNTEKYILKDFSLKLEKDTHYAFVGVNGAGKTTITKLLTGLYDNYEGTILINGRDLKEYKLSELKGLFSVVFQDFAKYAVSVKDNIALGDMRDKNDERIEEVARMFDLGDKIDSMSQGLDTDLGKVTKGSVDLSGGQWQRLVLARAFYNPAKVRILDEPTAALDAIAESNIYKSFSQISKGKTTIFITHRLGAARLAKQIIVIGDGKVAEMGSHEQLMEKKGIYADMFESQRSWYE